MGNNIAVSDPLTAQVVQWSAHTDYRAVVAAAENSSASAPITTTVNGTKFRDSTQWSQLSQHRLRPAGVETQRKLEQFPARRPFIASAAAKRVFHIAPKTGCHRRNMDNDQLV